MIRHFVRAVDILFSILAPALGFVIKHDGNSSLGYEKEVNDLCSAAEYKLNPEAPAPAQVLLDEATDDRTNDGSSNTAKNDIINCILLLICVPLYYIISQNPPKPRYFKSLPCQRPCPTSQIHPRMKCHPRSVRRLPSHNSEPERQEAARD